MVALDLFGFAALERPRCGQRHGEGCTGLLARALLRLAASLDAVDEVRDLRAPRVGALDRDRDRVAVAWIEPQTARRVAFADVAAVLRRCGAERVLGDSVLAQHADVARERIRLRH